jgi:Zn-dependent membrane protease YugP
VGIVAYSGAVLFQLVTLPVEFDASRRAMDRLSASGTMGPTQLAGARQVLTAAALTYVGAALISILQLIYFIGLGRRD